MNSHSLDAYAVPLACPPASAFAFPRKRRACLTLVALCGAACGGGDGHPVTQGAELLGRVVSASGAPLAGAKIDLEHCRVSDPPRLSPGGAAVATTTADAMAWYALDVDSNPSPEGCYVVRGPEEAGGGKAAMRVQLDGFAWSTFLPDLRPSRLSLHLEDTQAGADLTWRLDDLPFGVEAMQWIQVRSAGQLVWEQPVRPDARTAVLPTYLLEDFALPLVHLSVAWPHSPTLTRQAASAAWALVARDAAPSRGAECVVDGAVVAECPATDGDLTTAAKGESVELVLTTPLRARRLVARGVSAQGRIRVEASTDGGATYVSIGSSNGPPLTGYLDIALSASTPESTRYRVVAEGGGPVTTRELALVP